MTTADCEPALCTDAVLFRRVQQQNQEQVISKLLHDLRNPVHSMRITVELFSRLARQGADTAAVMTRAARYIGPAEAAVASLSKQIERLAVYLCPPVRPATKPIAVNEWLADIALLLRESTQGPQVGVESSLAGEGRLLADRPRLSHALLRWGLSHMGASAMLNARAADPDRIHIELAYAPREAGASAAPFDAGELRTLIENAGGEVVEVAGQRITVAFAVAL